MIPRSEAEWLKTEGRVRTKTDRPDQVQGVIGAHLDKEDFLAWIFDVKPGSPLEKRDGRLESTLARHLVDA